jgi:acyl-coenzyme A synthetase/AMP-(fatty) acid ligase
LAPPLLLISSALEPYPSAGSNANESCRENIARYKAPEYVGFSEEYPMTTSEKIWKYRLREADAERQDLATAGSA